MVRPNRSPRGRPGIASVTVRGFGAVRARSGCSGPLSVGHAPGGDRMSTDTPGRPRPSGSDRLKGCTDGCPLVRCRASARQAAALWLAQLLSTSARTRWARTVVQTQRNHVSCRDRSRGGARFPHGAMLEKDESPPVAPARANPRISRIEARLGQGPPPLIRQYPPTWSKTDPRVGMTGLLSCAAIPSAGCVPEDGITTPTVPSADRHGRGTSQANSPTTSAPAAPPLLELPPAMGWAPLRGDLAPPGSSPIPAQWAVDRGVTAAADES